jgi:uncharacterized protein (TIGR02246 family)
MSTVVSRAASSPQEAIAQAVAQMDHAFNHQDANALLAFYEETAVVVTPSGSTATGTAEIRSFFEATMSPGAHATQLKTSITEADGIALFLSNWAFHTADQEPNTPPQTFTAIAVFRKQPEGGWKALIDNPFGPLVLDAK